MHFTIQLRGEIGHQLVKVPNGSYQSIHDLTSPTQPMNTCEQIRPQHWGLHHLLFSNSDVGSLTSPTIFHIIVLLLEMHHTCIKTYVLLLLLLIWYEEM